MHVGSPSVSLPVLLYVAPHEINHVTCMVHNDSAGACLPAVGRGTRIGARARVGGRCRYQSTSCPARNLLAMNDQSIN